MLKSTLNRPRPTYTSPTKTSSNKSKLRTPKKPSPQKPTKKTNLSKRPLNSPNLEWDSGKVRLEILSPKIVREAAKATEDVEQFGDSLEEGQVLKNSDGNIKNQNKKRNEKISDDLGTLADQINVAKQLNQNLGLDSSTSIPEDLKATMEMLAREGNKVADALKRVHQNQQAPEKVEQLETTISKLKLELEEAKYQTEAAKNDAILHSRAVEQMHANSFAAGLPEMSLGPHAQALAAGPHVAAAN